MTISAKVGLILKFLVEKGKPQRRKKFNVWTIQFEHFFILSVAFFYSVVSFRTQFS